MKQRLKGFLALVLTLVIFASFALTGMAEETKKAYNFEQDDYNERPVLESGKTVVYPGDEIYTSQKSGGKIFCITDKKEGGAPLNTGSGDYYKSAIADKNGDFVDGITALSGGGFYTVPELATGYKAYVTHIGVFQNYFTPGYSPDDDPDVQEYYKLSSLYLEPVPVEYTVKFAANGGEGTTADLGLKYDEEKALTANAFTKKGYVFAGWNTKEDGTGTVYTDGAAVKNLSSEDGASITLYATWNVENPKTADNGQNGLTLLLAVLCALAVAATVGKRYLVK
ncbi:MAG: InlB B-repeat-containing protein [Clostridia bacterium]|nr:InlB B-repeat-containing protein [Clostridia bacterium]